MKPARTWITAALAFALAACKPAPPPDATHGAGSPTLFAAGNQQAQNFGLASWGNGRTLCIDPGAATSCSGGGAVADTNDCSCTCNAAGVGPCLHWYELENRWYGVSPVITQDTTIKFVSSQTGSNDPVIFKPILGINGGADAAAVTGPSINIVGTMTAGTGQSFTLTTAKNFPTNTAFVGTFSGSVTPELLLQNTTHASFAWATAKNNHVTQPLAATSTAANGAPVSVGAQVNTWTTSDSITPQTLPTVYVVDVEPYPTILNGTGIVTLVHLGLPENGASGIKPGDDPVIFGNNVQLIESYSERLVVWNVKGSNYQLGPGGVQLNCSILGGIQGGMRQGNLEGATSNHYGTPGIFAGQVWVLTTTYSGTGAIALGGFWLDDDVYLNNGVSSTTGVHFDGYNYFGSAEIEGKAFTYGTADAVTKNLNADGGVWGPQGTLDVAQGTFIVGAGVDGGGLTVKVNTVKLSSQTVGCSMIPSNALTTQLCNLPITMAEMDSIGGATSVCLMNGQASICNYGN